MAPCNDNPNGELPRCRPVLCGLRDRCIAAMLATHRIFGPGTADASVRIAVAGPCEMIEETEGEPDLNWLQPGAVRTRPNTCWPPRCTKRGRRPECRTRRGGLM